VAVSRNSDLAKPLERKPARPMICADLALMERELRTVQNDFGAVEATYGEDLLNLVIVTGYVLKLINNRRIENYLDENHPEILKGFRTIVSAASLEKANEEGTI
jgi:hypothetical protein